MKTELSGNRRTFFKHASLFGGFAVLLALGKPGAAESKPSVPDQGPSGQGYRLTEQIKQYYAAARK